jgi:hypothetical protein
LTASIGGIDFNGDGTTGDPLPGTAAGSFNRGLGRSDLIRLVDQFNQKYAGTSDAAGRPIPHIVLPATFALGNSFQALDARLSRQFSIGEHARLSLVGEAFNLYNKANLSGFSGNLAGAGFGQPTARAIQTFGSGGPRAFQLAAKVSF